MMPTTDHVPFLGYARISYGAADNPQPFPEPAIPNVLPWIPPLGSGDDRCGMAIKHLNTRRVGEEATVEIRVEELKECLTETLRWVDWE
jgi:hypothetical protein